jgi:hypothetical protein
MRTVDALGGTPYIPFTSRNVEPKDDSIWAKFGSSVRSKSEWGQVNEVLCKVLAHNICVVIRATHELGIEPAFGSKRTFESELPLEPKLFV